jgi:hypothetical protein
VALPAGTGDQWDYTTTQPISLADLRINGRTRKVLLQAPKNGFFYVIDRLTGPVHLGRTVHDDELGDQLDPATGRPIESPQARYGLTPVTLTPGPPGAHNWQPMSFHPGTGLVYFPVRVNAFQYSIDPAYKYNKGGRNLGVIAGPARCRASAAKRRTRRVVLLAWDPVAQKERWRVNFAAAAPAAARLPPEGCSSLKPIPRAHWWRTTLARATALVGAGRQRRGHTRHLRTRRPPVRRDCRRSRRRRPDARHRVRPPRAVP